MLLVLSVSMVSIKKTTLPIFGTTGFYSNTYPALNIQALDNKLDQLTIVSSLFVDISI